MGQAPAFAQVQIEQSGRVTTDPARAPNAIEASNITVAYRAYNRRPTSLKESLIRLFRGNFQKSYSMFNALSDVSFSVPWGSVFAIIGSNGCGKSTLLKVLAQVLKPTQGCVAVNGAVSSLIELGAGFDPELTGMENIFLNGSLHKKSESFMRSRAHHILEFAELGEFADTPVKYYSSGMYARLGFSVAVDIDPDVLLVDEILAVGDERFQKKCQQVFDSFIARGKTIVWVTHDMDLVAQKAHRAMLLERGQVSFIGDPTEAVRRYRESTYQPVLA